MQLPPKRLVMSYAVPALSIIVDVPYEQASPDLQQNSNFACPTSTITALHYKPTKDQEVQMPLQKIVESKYFQRFTQDWQNEVNTFNAYSQYRRKSIYMLTQISFMWDKHSGQINIPKHRVKLLPNSNLVYLTLFRAGPTLLEFQCLEIEKILSGIVIEPA